MGSSPTILPNNFMEGVAQPVEQRNRPCSRLPTPAAENAYMINVASYQNGIGYGQYTHISGFSEKVLEFIALKERDDYVNTK